MTRVLVVDDSSFMRTSVKQLLQADESIDVVGTASEGAQAIRLVSELRPDVVILDIEMAGMNGLDALCYIMQQQPTPVLVLTGLKSNDPSIALKCLEQGAVDVLLKPSGEISYDIGKLKNELITKVHTAAALSFKSLGKTGAQRRGGSPGVSHDKETLRIVVMGASTGGPRAVATILPDLPGTLAAIVLVVVHLSPEFVPYLARSLDSRCSIPVCVAREEERLAGPRILIAPGGCNTRIKSKRGLGRICFDLVPSPHYLFPCIDSAMSSAAQTYGDAAVGVLLTGTGNDGALGLRAIKNAGGRTFVEDPATCLAPFMPEAAIRLGCVDQIVPLGEMAHAIVHAI